MDGLTPGRIVHFVTEEGKHLAAIIVHIYNQEGHVGLQSFDMMGCVGRFYVPFDPTGTQPYSWHWIEKA